MKRTNTFAPKGYALALVCLMLLAQLLLPLQALALTEDELMEKMHEHIKDNFNIDEEAYTLVNFIAGNEQCAFSVKLNEPPPAEDGLIIGAMNHGGELMDLRGSSEMTLDKQIQLSLHSSLSSLESMYAFKCKWQAFEAALSDSEWTETYIWPRYREVINMDISLPSEDDIDQELAYQHAKESIAALPGWTQEKLDLYDLIIEVHYTPKSSAKPVYHFVFHRRSSLDEQYEGKAGEKAYEAYEKVLYESFGGNNLTTPIYLSVMIDAQTGALTDEVTIEFPGQSPTHFLDFILR